MNVAMSKQQQQSRGGLSEFQASLHIHAQQANVLRSGLEDAVEQVYLGDNEYFKPGDIVQIIPVAAHQAQAMNNKAVNEDGNNYRNPGVAERSQPGLTSQQTFRQSPVILPQKGPHDNDNQSQTVTARQEVTPRQSLVVSLNNSFYKANQQQKKLFISIDQTLAELHGFRKDMQVIVKKLNLEELDSFSNNFPAQNLQQKPLNVFNTRLSSKDSRQNVGALQQSTRHYQSLVADRVEVTIRDQFVSRRDMWYLVQKLNARTIYKGLQIDLSSIRFKIRNIYTANRDIPISNSSQQSAFRGIRNGNQSFNPSMNRNKPQSSGSFNPMTNKSGETNYIEQNSAIVTASYTRFTFLTKSCQVYCLIELSKEMYSFDSEGFMQAEKCEIFVRNYLERCKADYSTHEVVFILYARLYYPQIGSLSELLKEAQNYTGQQNLTLNDLENQGAYQFSKAKAFQDVYLKAGVVTLTLDVTKTDYDKFIIQLKQQIQNFPQTVNWKINCPQNLLNVQKESNEDNTSQKYCYRLPCELGDSERTNLLEVINLALFNLNNEETDLNLRTTGTQMILITAGMATYRVNSGIISHTKERLLLGGVQVQLVSFAREPPYKTPLLIKCCSYTNPFEKRDTRGHHKAPNSPRKQNFNNQQQQSKFSQPDGRAPCFAGDSMHNTAERDQSQFEEGKKKCDHFLLDWMSVTFLPHIKLLETHILANSQQRKTNALLQLSKTPLLAPQFYLFQQVRLVASVFNGLASQDERLFQPHSMFAVNPPSARKIQLQKVKTNSQKVSSQTKGKKRKFWRIDPEMYQLRKPIDGNEKYLLQDAEAEQAQALLDRNKTSITLAQNPILSENDESFWESCDEIRIQGNLTPGSQRSPQHSVHLTANMQVETIKRNLQRKMQEYDTSLRGEGLTSPVTSLASSPVKQYFELSPVKIPYYKPSLTSGNAKEQIFFSSNILCSDDSSQNVQKSAKTISNIKPQMFPRNQMTMSTQNPMSQLKFPKTHSQLDFSSRNPPTKVGEKASQQQMIESQIFNSNTNNQFDRNNTQVQKIQHYANQNSMIGAASSFGRVNNLASMLASNCPRSYVRRWGHAVQTFQVSLFDKSKQNQQIRKGSTNTSAKNSTQQQHQLYNSIPYSLSYDQLQELGGFDRRQNAYDLAITQNYFEPLCKLMDPFWRQLSDVVLMPLTTEYFPEQKPACYKNDLNQLDYKTDVQENLCLRLTQNFQFVNIRGSCDMQLTQKKPGDYYYRMAFRDIYADCKSNGIDQFETQTHFKFNDKEDAIDETFACFRYLLFNHHTKQLQVKVSQESRLFTIRKLKNLTIVQQDLLEAKDHCIKLPQVSFVIFYDRQEARKLRGESFNIEKTWNDEEIKQRERLRQEEIYEQEAFEKMRNGLVQVLQSMGQKNKGSIVSLEKIKVIKMSSIKEKNNLSPPEELDSMQQVQRPSEVMSQFTTPYSSASKLALSDDQADVKFNKWPQDIMGSFLGPAPGTPNKYDNHIIHEMESSLASNFSNSIFENEQMNMSMQFTPYTQGQGMHSSIIRQGEMNNFTLMQSGRLPRNSLQHQKRTAATDDKVKNSKKCVINLSSQSRHSAASTTPFSKTQMGSGFQNNSQQQTPQINSEKASQFLLEHDAFYTTGACFHIKFQWIFACGPEIQERVIKRLLRQVKELSNGCFKTLPLSEIVRSLQLNPFESETLIREDYSRLSVEALTKRNIESSKLLEQQSVLNKSDTNNLLMTAGGEDFSMILYDDEDDSSMDGMPSNKMSNRQSRFIRQTIVGQNTIFKQERMFQKAFPRILIDQCGFVLDNKSKDEKCTYFLEKETGLSYLRFNTTNNQIKFSENDITNNAHGDYQAAIRSREKVETTIMALDLLLSMLFDPNLLS